MTTDMQDTTPLVEPFHTLLDLTLQDIQVPTERLGR